MLGNIFLKTLRDNRWAIAGVGLGLALIMIVSVTQYPQLVSGTGAARAAQVAEFTKLMQSFSALLGEIVPIDTLGGFLTLRILGVVPVFLGLWTVVVGAGMIRGEEELGALDVLLSTPHRRVAVFGQKLAALGLGLLVILVLTGLGTLAGLPLIADTLPVGGVLVEILNIGLIAAFWGAAALLAAQLVSTRRTAATIVGGLLFASYLVDNLAEGQATLKGLTWVLPFHYYGINKPLVPGRAVDVLALAVLALGTAILLGLAFWMFLRRDLGSVFPLPGSRLVGGRRLLPQLDSQALLGSVFAKTFRDLLGATLGWGLGLAALAALLVGTTNETLAPMRDVMHNLPWLGNLVGNRLGNFATAEGYLSGFLAFMLPLILTLFALLQVASWTSDEESGRLEMVVGAPQARVPILLERYAAIVCSVAGILALFGAGLLGTAALTNTSLDAGRVGAMLLDLGVVALIVLAGGLAVATWRKEPGAALPIVGTVVLAMYLFDLLAQIFTWPDAVRALSIYYLAGQPLLQGLLWGNFAVLVGGALLLAGGSLAGFARRDIAK